MLRGEEENRGGCYGVKDIYIWKKEGIELVVCEGNMLIIDSVVDITFRRGVVV